MARAIEFAIVNRHAWAALCDLRLPDGVEPPELTGSLQQGRGWTMRWRGTAER